MTDDGKTTFGSYLRTLRESADVSMTRLAKDMDISPAYLSDVERDNRAPLGPSRILFTRKALSLTRSQEIHLRFLAAKRNGKLVIDVSGLTDYALEVLISMTMDAPLEDTHDYAELRDIVAGEQRDD